VLGEMLELGPEAPAYHTSLAEVIERMDIDRVHTMGDLYAGLWAHLPPSRRGVRAGSLGELKNLLSVDLHRDDLVLFKGSHGTQMHQLVPWMLDKEKSQQKERLYST